MPTGQEGGLGSLPLGRKVGAMGIRDWLARGSAEPAAKQQPARKAAVPKQRPPAAPRHRVVDVAGTWERLASHYNFDAVLRSLSLGPVKVTMRLEPNDANPYGISAYIGDSQVGYLNTKNWAATDPWVAWMLRLDAAGIWPRFEGIHRLTTDERKENIVNIRVPAKRELSAIADQLIAGEQTS
jgi:hypothetical protein